jgi:predicted phage terminase large subunit-like protein
MAFLGTPADIAIYGGGAGGGKTWALLMEPLRHVANPEFGAVFFRRTTVQIRNEGGLWDESQKLYRHLKAKPKELKLEWKFPSGATGSMAHLEYDKTVNNWQGSQIALELFDELTHFTEKQFFYMLSRNRSMCGVRPYVRATCNPDADSWVARFIAWWIDEKTGYPIPERAGVLRYFVRIGAAIHWADNPADLAQYTMKDEDGNEVPIPPKSVTFIPAKLTDNKALMNADPGYMANLMALSTVERERLLGGNWKIRPAGGLLFRRGWCDVVDAVPAGTVWARGWDLAATPKTDTTPDPDATAGTKIGKMPDGRYIVGDFVEDWLSPNGVRSLIKNTAAQDGQGTQISLPQDPGQAGKDQKQNLAKMLTGYDVRFSPESGDKVTRFSPFSAQAEAGNVVVLRGHWNEPWFSALEGFPEAAHDDAADSTSRAFNALNEPKVQVAMMLTKRHRR